MKKSLALILGLCIFLSACTAGNGPETIGDPTTTPSTSSQTTATTAPAETGGTNETLEPKETEPPVNPSHPATPLETQPEETEPPTMQPTVIDPTTSQEAVTEPAVSSTEPPSKPAHREEPEPETEPTEQAPIVTPETQPSTEPTQGETEPPTTEPVALYFDAAEDYGNAYGVNTYQWVADPSLTMNNAGFNFPDTVSMEGLQENGGQEYLNRLVKEGVDTLYTTLSLYGSPEGCRINCHIEFLNSVTIAIYILYG